LSASLWFLQGDSLEFWFKTTAEHAETTGAPCFFICGWSCEALTWVQTLMCTVVCPKTVQDNYIARSEAWANLLCCKFNWPTKQLSLACILLSQCWFTSTTVATVKSRAHATSLEASCHLALASQDEDYAWYLAQRGLLFCSCTPKATLDVIHDLKTKRTEQSYFPLKRWLYLARSGSSTNRWSCGVLVQ
jgi:hypothetical protein